MLFQVLPLVIIPIALPFSASISQSKALNTQSEEVALEEIHRLREEWPDAYPEPERFETELVRYLRRTY